MSIDPCDPNPCGTGAVCEVAEGKALCSCSQGMTGDPLVKCGKYLILYTERAPLIINAYELVSYWKNQCFFFS